MSWLGEQVGRSLAYFDQPVDAGYVLALALLCVLQYLLHVYRLHEASRHAERYRGETAELENDLRAAQKDRSLSHLENAILREFVSQTQTNRALDLLIRRFVPFPDEGFGALLCPSAQAGGEYVVHQSRGLTEESQRRLQLAGEFLQRVLSERVLVLTGQTLRSSGLLACLAADDRRKVRRLYLLAVGLSGEAVGVMVATALYPPGAPADQQLELAGRLMQSVAGDVKRSQALEQRELQLRSTSEMLELRSIIDGRHETPMAMIHSFLERLTEKLGCSRGAIYLSTRESEAGPRALTRCGENLPAVVEERCREHENRLAERHFGGSGPTTYDTDDLREVGIDSLIGGALVAPLLQEASTIGVLCFTKSERAPFATHHVALARWAAGHFAETLLRALNQAVIKRQAHQDGLTELANRRVFDQQIRDEVRKARAASDEVSLLLVDLDHFKSINDTHGHQAGDDVLRKTAQLLQQQAFTTVRSSDRVLVARYGGEEIVVMLPRIGIAGAARIAESLRASVEAATWAYGEEPIAVTVSVGTATFPGHAAGVDQLIAAADTALYRAKESGRNRVVSAGEAGVLLRRN